MIRAHGAPIRFDFGKDDRMTEYERRGMSADLARHVIETVDAGDWSRLRALAGRACILRLIRAARAHA